MKRIAIILIVIGAVGLYFLNMIPKKSLQVYADAVVKACEKESYAPSCYDREIPKLMDKISMEDAFEVTRLVQVKDQRYLYCHVLAHNLSLRETSKDITKWKDVVARCPTTVCNNGCQHGALMRRFNAESLTDDQIQEVKPDLLDVCEPRGSWNPREIERSMCYHALGHLNMFITDADIPKSVSLCNDISVKSDGRNYTQTCTQGVLMSVYQPLEPEDFALVKDIAPTKNTVNAFCNQFTGEAWFACHSESWPLFLEDIKKPTGLLRFCSYTSDPDKKHNCIATGLSILTVLMVVDRDNKLDTLTTYCNELPRLEKGQCFASSAFRLVQIDPRYIDTAISVCEAAEVSGVGDPCYSYVLQHKDQSFAKGSGEATDYCNHFKDPWKEKCREI